MDILSNLPYSTFDHFYVSVEKIEYDWMYLNVGTDERHISYTAGNICGPLNDLLDVAVSMAKGEKIDSPCYDTTPNSIGNYFYVTHDLEGDFIIWLFKYVNEELTLIIWNGFPTDMDTLYDLAEADFDDKSFQFRTFDDAPDLTKELALAMKGSLQVFIQALIHTFERLKGLKRFKDDASDWGFSYALDSLEFLKDWIAKNDNPKSKSLK
jgi:hypothetical protein